MKYDFDRLIDRRNTNSIKWDFPEMFGKPEDVIPLWVADMDFPAPPEVIERLEAAVRHGIFGYSEALPGYFEAVRNWFESNFDFRPEADWLVKTPGVVFALATAIRALTKEGEAIVIQEPVYHPFRGMIEVNKRRVIDSPLIFEDGHYSMDFDDLDKKLAESGARLFILCSPHNPVGRVWKREELETLSRICQKYGCLVLADEIHCDFVRPGFRHTSWGTMSPEAVDNSIICTAPSKTFNLAGLQAANIFIPNPEIRAGFKAAMERCGYHGLNSLALVAAQAAYELGRPWLDELRGYLEGNLEYVRQAVGQLPGLKVIEPEGCYLIWLDFRGLSLSDEKLDELIIQKAGLWLDEGRKFGQAGRGFYRLNSACPRSLLEKALARLQKALA